MNSAEYFILLVSTESNESIEVVKVLKLSVWQPKIIIPTRANMVIVRPRNSCGGSIIW